MSITTAEYTERAVAIPARDAELIVARAALAEAVRGERV